MAQRGVLEPLRKEFPFSHFENLLPRARNHRDRPCSFSLPPDISVLYSTDILPWIPSPATPSRPFRAEFPPAATIQADHPRPPPVGPHQGRHPCAPPRTPATACAPPHGTPRTPRCTPPCTPVTALCRLARAIHHSARCPAVPLARRASRPSCAAPRIPRMPHRTALRAIRRPTQHPAPPVTAPRAKADDPAPPLPAQRGTSAHREQMFHVKHSGRKSFPRDIRNREAPLSPASARTKPSRMAQGALRQLPQRPLRDVPLCNSPAPEGAKRRHP